MIAVIIFFIHVVGAVAVYTRSWMRGGIGEGFLGLAFVGVIFSVGWTFASFLVKPLLPPEGFATWFDQNTAGLILLTALEFVVYKIYFWDYLFRVTAAKEL
jgi:hypothetical protein